MGIEMEVWIAAMPLRHAFTISRSTARTAQAVFVRMRHEALEGLGETVPSAFYGHTAESVAAALERLRPWLASADPSAPRALALEAFAQLNGDRAALCALDVALCDLAARRAQAPLWRWLGLRSGPIPPTTYTIGLDSIERMAAKLVPPAAAEGFAEVTVIRD